MTASTSGPPELVAPTLRPPPQARSLWIAGAALVGVYLVTHLLLLSRFPWFVDEALFATYAQTVEGDRNQRFIALIDHKGLINSWIGAILIKLGISPMVALRLISVLAGLVTAAATGWLVRRWRDSPLDGVIAAGLTLFVPYLFVHNAVGVYDSFVVAGSMVALVLQLSLARSPRLDRALLLGITLGMLLLAKPTGALAIALAPLSLAVFDWGAARRARRLAMWAGISLLGLLIAGAMYALTRLSPLAYTEAPDNRRTIGEFLADPFELLGRVAPDAVAATLGYMTLPLLCVGIWGIWCAVRDRDRIGLVLTGWVLASLAAYLLLTDNAYPRYGLQLAAPLCALALLGGWDVWDRLARRWSPRTAYAVAALAILPALIFDARVTISPTTAPYPGRDRDQYVVLLSNREPVRDAAAIITERAPESFSADTPPADRTVALLTLWPEAGNLALNGSRFSTAPRFSLLYDTSDPAAVNAARYVIVDGPAPPWLDVSKATLLQSWQRPGGGPRTELYDRGPSAPTSAKADEPRRSANPR